MVFRLDLKRISRYNTDAECLRRVIHESIGNKFWTALPSPESLSVRVIDIKDFIKPGVSWKRAAC